MTDIDEATIPSQATEPTVPRDRVVLYCLAIVGIATAVIHFAVAGAHFQEYWLFGVFMLVTAWLQLLWAIVAIARPSRLLLWSGALLNAGVVAVYIVTRTIGDVIGPTPHAVEPFGFGDGLCTVLEAAVAAGCGWLLIATMDHRVGLRRLITASATTGAVIAILLSAALVDGGPDMVMNMSGSSVAGPAPAMPMPGMKTSPIKIATATPAGDITMPDTTMPMPGMKMASSAPCNATPTAAQQKAAVGLVNASWQGAGKYQSLAAAQAAGYRPVTPTGRPVVHYVSPSSYRAAVLGGPVLNTAEPQSLVYANTPQGAVLAAAMYITSPGDPPRSLVAVSPSGTSTPTCA